MALRKSIAMATAKTGRRGVCAYTKNHALVPMVVMMAIMALGIN